MSRRIRLASIVLVAALVAASTSACARPGPAMQVLDATVRAVGGRPAIEATRTLVIEGEGEAFILGQGEHPGRGNLKYRVTGYRHALDLAHARWRKDKIYTPLWNATSLDPIPETTALDGTIAFDPAGDGTASRAPEAVARDRRAELWHSPLGLLQAALAPGATVSNHRRVGPHDLVDIRAPAAPSSPSRSTPPPSSP